MQSKTSYSDVRYSQKRRYVRKDQKDDVIPNETQAPGLRRSDSYGTLHTECDRVESHNYYTPSTSKRGSRRNSKRNNQKSRKTRNKQILPLSDNLLQAGKNLIASTAAVKKVSAWCCGMPKFGHDESIAETASSVYSAEETKTSTASEIESETIKKDYQNVQTQQEGLNSNLSSFNKQREEDDECRTEVESVTPCSEVITTETPVEPEVEISIAEKPHLSFVKSRARRKDPEKLLALRISKSNLDSKLLPRSSKIAIIYLPEEHKEPAKLQQSNEKPQTPKITVHPPTELSEVQKPLSSQENTQKPHKKSLRRKQAKKETIEKADENQDLLLEDPIRDDSHSEHLTCSTTPDFNRSKTQSSDEDGRIIATELEAVQCSKAVYDFQTIMSYVETLNFFKPQRKIKKYCNRHIKCIYSWKITQNFAPLKRSSPNNGLIDREPDPCQNFRAISEKAELNCSSWRIINEEFIKKAKETSAKVQAKPDEIEASRRQIKITLNKLTFNNFEKLKPRLYDLSIISEESLNFLVESILNKACTESKFTSLYAKLCSYLLEEYHKFQFSECHSKSSHSIKNNKFRRALFESCQSLYEYFDEDSLQVSKSGDVQYDKAQIKKKILGNVRFIGELFREGVILNRIVLECIVDLIEPSIKKRNIKIDCSKLNLKEEKLEGACILLLTGGACFDKEGIIKDTDRLFKILEEIHTRSDLSPRIKFLIINVLDARKMGWTEKEETTVETKGEEEIDD